MRLHPRLLLPFFVLCHTVLMAQYQFSGRIDTTEWSGDVYLSLVEDYRKLHGIYPEQIIKKVIPDSTGFFTFEDNNLPENNHIYKIHVGNCSPNEQQSHLRGVCAHQKEIVFIAKNTDTLTFPFSFDREMFCKVVSNNFKSSTFIQADSLLNEMRYAFGNSSSPANYKINAKKWFKKLQQFGIAQKEPLTELYLYAYLSDKSNRLYSYYLKDLKQNAYYTELKERLLQHYPQTNYSVQYDTEITSDFYRGTPLTTPETFNRWTWILLSGLLLSLAGNAYLLYQFQQRKKTSLPNIHQLTKQEQKILQLIREDKTNKEIAASLFLSLSTIKTHINSLYKKLKVSSREEVKSLKIKE
ncbi:response regulator transcription factor [Aquimarina hainanensis]|uniref:Response regulator transcription factor n=1 Tax=Aquimarina hainanensis TaxID=1578017 RepID=A0ABW5N7A8_9FLAO